MLRFSEGNAVPPIEATKSNTENSLAKINLENVGKRYGNGHVAVKEVSLEIRDGEFLVLVGPSGSGKSTLLRMIAGLETVSAGDVLFDGQRINDVEPGDRDVAMVFQNYALYPHMTIRKNLSFGLQMRKTTKGEIAERVAAAAKTLSIQSLLDRKPKQLSGGQQQRVAVGRAIVRQPKAFLFDEPLSNLDAKLRVQMRNELARLHQRLKTTTVYVTHDQVEAMTLGDRIAVMRDGVILQVGAPLDVYRNPANRFVAEFIGSPAMNFLEGNMNDGVFETGAVRFQIWDDSFKDHQLPEGPVVFGFRPEDVVVGDRAEHALLGEATLEIVQRMGHESLVYFELEGTQVVSRMSGDTDLKAGDSVKVTLLPSKARLFTADAAGCAF